MPNLTQGASAPLIKLHNQTIQGSNVECVNARDLHLFLEVGRDFSNWIKARIKQYNFEVDVDYITLNEFSPVLAKTSASGGRPTIDYYLTLDMAKELAMVERNEKGRQARRYFIECEKRLREESKAQGDTLPAPAQSLTPELLKLIESRSIEVAIQAREKAFKRLTQEVKSELKHRPPHEVIELTCEQSLITRPYIVLGGEVNTLLYIAKMLPDYCKQLQGVLNQAQA